MREKVIKTAEGYARLVGYVLQYDLIGVHRGKLSAADEVPVIRGVGYEAGTLLGTAAVGSVWVAPAN